MNIYKRNEYKNYISTTMYMTAYLAVTGTILQTFMLETGISENKVTLAVSIFQLVQGSSMILLSVLVERIKNVIYASAVGMLNLIPLLIVMLFFGISGNFESTVVYYTLLITGIISNVLLGFYNVIVYKLPYHIMDMSEYGRITANSGAIQGIFGIAVSAYITYLLGRHNYFSIMNPFLLGCIIIAILSVLLGFSYKQVGMNCEVGQTRKKINLFTYKPFYLLFIPNLTRGICFGFINVAVSIGYFFNVINSETSGYIVIITNIAIILSNVIYSFIGRKGKNASIILISSVTTALTMPIMLVGENLFVFLIAYTVAYLTINIAAIAIPVSVPEFVDYNVMGQYTAWRMMLMTIGTSIGGMMVIPMIKLIGGIATLAIAGIMQFITGIAYYFYLKGQREKKKGKSYECLNQKN